MRRRIQIPIVILVGLSIEACSSPQAASLSVGSNESAARDEIVLSNDQESAAQIQTQPAAISREPDLLRVKGKIALADDHTWRVGVRTVGLVVGVYANLGDFVHKDQVLARYHADEVRDARAQYRTALSELSRAKAAEAQAQRNLDRARRLLELKAGSPQQVELASQEVIDAKTAVRKLEIEIDRGRDQLEDDLRVPADPPPNRADETEDDVPILAPHDGFVLERNVTTGKAVELSTDTFTIGDLSEVWMLASVRQEDLGKLHMGQAAVVTLPGVDGFRAQGKITNLGQQFDPTTRVMQVRVGLANPQGRLRPEMLANAEIPIGLGKPSLSVLSDAIQQVNGANVVFIRTAPRRYALRSVQAGETADGRTPILEGVAAGEQVVIRGSFVLKSQLLKSTLENE